ncbi:MAG: hypothetical protein OXC11_15605, partial [Rhodospirillales bacterium]|nr:hypothetical protein [Rhodospirillales bacterium]
LDGFTLTGKTDALVVRTTSDAAHGPDSGGLAAARATLTRLRLGLEGSRAFRLGSGATLTPSLAIGLRHDDGDAETGFGLELDGGLAWSDTTTGLRAEVSGRGLLTHERAGFRQRSFAGSLSWDPAPDSDQGPRLMLSQTVGVSAAGGTDALLGQRTLERLAASDDGDELDRRRLELKLGYGVGALGNRFTSTPELVLGLTDTGRELILGWRLRRAVRDDPGSLEFALEGWRRESGSDNAAPEHGIDFQLTARF